MSDKLVSKYVLAAANTLPFYKVMQGVSYSEILFRLNVLEFRCATDGKGIRSFSLYLGKIEPMNCSSFGILITQPALIK
jgi:hypothetical protein